MDDSPTHPTRKTVIALGKYASIDQLNKMLELLKIYNSKLDNEIPKEGEDNKGGDNYFSRGGGEEKEEEIRLCFEAVDINNKQEEEQQLISIREGVSRGGGGGDDFLIGEGEVKEEENGDDDDDENAGDSDDDENAGDSDNDDSPPMVDSDDDNSDNDNENDDNAENDNKKERKKRKQFVNNLKWFGLIKSYEDPIPENPIKKLKLFQKLGKLLNEPGFEFEMAQKKFGYTKEEQDILFRSEITENQEIKMRIGQKVSDWIKNNNRKIKKPKYVKGTDIANQKKETIKGLRFENKDWGKNV